MRFVARRSTLVYGAVQYAKRQLIGGQADETRTFT
jgi:hypothetical protein